LAGLPEALDDGDYFQRLLTQARRTLEKNRRQAAKLAEAHQWLCQIAACLHYPPDGSHPSASLNSTQVAKDMETLIHSLHADPKTQRPQALLLSALQKRWRLYSQELLPCYDIPGLPQDNLQMESLFENLRRRQRRISGRKSTQELRDFGQAQVLFQASSEEVLLQQIRQVPLAEYRLWQSRLRQAETPHQFIRRLHRDPAATMTRLVEQYIFCCTSPAPAHLDPGPPP